MSISVRPRHLDEATLYTVGEVSCVVAIPVRNEGDRIVECLEALTAQVDVEVGSIGLLLFLNNCTDGTRGIVEAWAPGSLWALRIVVQDSPSASAGWARRQAMDAGAAWLETAEAADGLLLTTDADSRVAPDWIARNRAAVAAGVDAVAGRVVFDPAEVAMLPLGLRERQDLEAEYEALLAEIEARLDPRRGNPWPCHWTKSGASIAVSLATYRRVGGIPPLPSGEDHAFIDLLGEHGLLVRHAPDIVVTTSGRLDGRAQGGTADTLRHWCSDLDSPCDAQLERLGAFVAGVLKRRFVTGRRRQIGQRALRPSGLPRQIRRARLLLRLLRLLEADRGGRRPSATLSREPPKRLLMP